MKRAFEFVLVGVLAAEALAIGQGGDVARVLADVRNALGGEAKLSGVKTLAVTGQTVRVTGETSSPPVDFEFAMELPDKFVKKEVLAVIGGSTIARTTGFNGGELIDVMDTPPQMPGMMLRMAGPGAPPPGVEVTPEEQALMRRSALLVARQDFARLALGLFAASFSAYPLEFRSAGRAESPDGAADVVEVTGEDGFAAKLFVDGRTRLPLMLTWMAREPARMTMSRGGEPAAAAGAGGHVVAGAGHVVTSGAQLTPEERDRLAREAAERLKAMEGERRVVEHRLYYADYKAVDGIKIPFRIQRAVDGRPAEELTVEKVRVNGKIDPTKFQRSVTSW
jgi:hypothetical protein